MKEFIIPDNSGSQSGNDCRHSMWGIYCGEGGACQFYCNFCAMIIKVNFPRFVRSLNKTHIAEDVIKMHWVCPGCCKPTPVLELLDKGTF